MALGRSLAMVVTSAVFFRGPFMLACWGFGRRRSNTFRGTTWN